MVRLSLLLLSVKVSCRWAPENEPVIDMKIPLIFVC
jgi:hypothetical protein